MDGNQHSNWKALAKCNLKWKDFVQAKNEKKIQKIENFKTFNTSLTGKEVKCEYENIINQHTKSEICVKEEKPDVTPFTEASTSVGEDARNFDIRSIYKALNFAQNNELTPLKDMLFSGLDVDSKDEHGWSLLMVAACAGSFDVVKLLLQHQANASIRDSNGNTAVYLASMKGHQMIVDLLIRSAKGNDMAEDEEVVLCDSPETEFFCDVCQITVKQSTPSQHETSIVHQFKLGSNGNKTIYGISPSNKGYQLLLNQGWNTEKGLGLKSNGVKFPVKTVLKQNREGLGFADEKIARVTHFGPGDKNAVKGPKSSERIARLKTLKKIDKVKEKRKNIKSERDIRRMLNEPDF